MDICWGTKKIFSRRGIIHLLIPLEIRTHTLKRLMQLKDS